MICYDPISSFMITYQHFPLWLLKAYTDISSKIFSGPIINILLHLIFKTSNQKFELHKESQPN